MKPSHVAFTLALLFAVICCSSAEAQEAVRRRLDVANNLYKAEAYTEAVSVLDDLLSPDATIGDPLKAASFALRGYCKWQLKDLSGAYSDLNAACDVQKSVEDGQDKFVAWSYDRATLASANGHYDKQIKHLKSILALVPTHAAANNDMAWTLATCSNPTYHDGVMSIYYATSACAVTKFDNPSYLDTLAAAFARAKRFEEAVLFQERTMSHPSFLKEFQGEALKTAAQRLKLYNEKKPYQKPKPPTEPKEGG